MSETNTPAKEFRQSMAVGNSNNKKHKKPIHPREFRPEQGKNFFDKNQSSSVEEVYTGSIRD